MSKAVKFTAGRVAGFQFEPSEKGKSNQSVHWDSSTPGLGVRVTPKGTKSYIFEARLFGKTLRITIGDVRTWTLAEAQAEARVLKTWTDRGIDPRQERLERAAAAEAKREEARRQEVTVREAWAAYVDARRKKWSARHLADHENLARPGGTAKRRGPGVTEAGPLAELMPLKLKDLTPEQTTQWLEKETARRPTYAALGYRLLRAFLRWCASHADYQGVTHIDAVGTRITKDHVPGVKAKNGDCLQREQLPSWFKAVREMRNPVQAAYLQSLLLTGARREELASLTWADVDFQWKSLTMRDKVEGERIIPLTPYVAMLLNSLPRRTMEVGEETVANPWVFSSPTAANGRIQEPRISHNRALAVAGLPHVTLHGLRRSFGTLSEWVECPAGVIAQIQGHKPSAIAEKHYRRRPLDLLRMWHTRIEAWILKQAGIKQSQRHSRGLHLVQKNEAA